MQLAYSTPSQWRWRYGSCRRIPLDILLDAKKVLGLCFCKQFGHDSVHGGVQVCAPFGVQSSAGIAFITQTNLQTRAWIELHIICSNLADAPLQRRRQCLQKCGVVAKAHGARRELAIIFHLHLREQRRRNWRWSGMHDPTHPISFGTHKQHALLP